MLHIPIVHAHDSSKQISLEKNFHQVENVIKTIVSYISCAFIEIWSTWEVWRALKKLELLSAMPQATLTCLSCSPNFLHASYLDECTLMYEPIVKYYIICFFCIFRQSGKISSTICLVSCFWFSWSLPAVCHRYL